MPKILPNYDVQPYDSFEMYLSNRTGRYLLYRFRHVPGKTTKEAAQIDSFGSKQEAMRIRNKLRKVEEEKRSSYEYDERMRVWAAISAEMIQ